MSEIDPGSLSPQMLLLYAMIVVVLSKVIDRLFDLIGELTKKKEEKAQESSSAHNGRSMVDVKAVAEEVSAINRWNQVEGAGVVRVMNAVADYIQESTLLLQGIKITVDDQKAEMREVRQILTHLAAERVKK